VEDRALAAREDGNWERSMDQKDNRFYRERDERIDAVESARAIRRIGHLIESGYLPRELADDLQRLINMAMMWEMTQAKGDPDQEP
jgi:hypothetical protein